MKVLFLCFRIGKHLVDHKWAMGVARLSNQSTVPPFLPQNAAQCNQPFCGASKQPDGSHEARVPTDYSEMPMIRELISGNKICMENGLFILIFGFTSIVLIVCCLTARRRRLSTLIIGSLLILTYFSIGFGFIDPHWIEGRPKTAILTTYCFFNKGSLVQVPISTTSAGLQ